MRTIEDEALRGDISELINSKKAIEWYKKKEGIDIEDEVCSKTYLEYEITNGSVKIEYYMGFIIHPLALVCILTEEQMQNDKIYGLFKKYHFTFTYSLDEFEEQLMQF